MKDLVVDKEKPCVENVSTSLQRYFSVTKNNTVRSRTYSYFGTCLRLTGRLTFKIFTKDVRRQVFSTKLRVKKGRVVGVSSEDTLFENLITKRTSKIRIELQNSIGVYIGFSVLNLYESEVYPHI